MKKQYDAPFIEVIVFENEDVVTTSNPDPANPDFGVGGLEDQFLDISNDW